MKAESSRVTLCPDGVYRWFYEFPMMKNPTILFTIWKVLLIASCVPAFVAMIADWVDGEFIKGLWAFVQVLGVAFGVLFVLSLIAYLILAIIYGFKYVVLFEMSDKELNHIQQPKQFKKAEAMGWLVALTGAAAENPTVAGSGLLASAKQATTTTLANADKVIGLRKRNTIKVNQWFNKNQVYVCDEDYDMVWEFITKRTTKAKIVE